MFDKYIEKAVQIGAVRSPEMLELMLEADCAGIRSSREAVERQIEYYGPESFEGKWLEEHAGKDGVGVDGKAKSEELTGNGEPVERVGGQTSKRRGKGSSTGRDASKGKGSRDTRQGLSPDEIQRRFGDVPW